MVSKYSTINTVKRTPLVHGERPTPLIMWGKMPARRQAFRMRTQIHPRIVGLGATLLIAAFATDLAYAQSELFQWENFSMWLITAGLVLAVVAAIALIFDAVLHRITAIDWPRFCGFAGAVLLSVLNAFVHSRDAYTAVVPQGVLLSGISTAILLALGWWHGWSVAKARPSSSLPEELQS